ncbi:DUF3027 domain-containing protein [Curtobacterium pusillum]|uniref:DUF3027 domain-containing protein n=1 Tax=Curtobacterium pusillum TaxID=69373 RepID=UPI003820EFBA
MTETSPTAPAPSEDLTARARKALLEVTPESTVGAPAGTVDEGDGVVSVLFANRMPGYPGWRWTVSIAQVEGDEPTVLEVELMPGDGSLVAPDWVPWSERLAEYRAGQDAEHDDEADEDDDADDDDEDADYDDADDDESDDDETDFDADEDDLDESDDDDIEGVDVDELDDEADDDDDDDEAVVTPPPSRGARRRSSRVRPVDPDEDLETDRLDAGEVDPERHGS